MIHLQSTEVSLIFNKILEEDIVLNNANVALLQEFAILWTNTALREDAICEGTFCRLLQIWLKRVQQLHKQEKLTHGGCIVSIFILEEWLNSADLDRNTCYSSLLSRTFVDFHTLIVSACMTKNNEITSSNDAIIAFFRLHCCLSKKVKGAELIRKYNLWKPLLSFYFQSNRFNLFIQNSCTVYIRNLINAEFPNELISFLEVLNASIQCIKNTIENDHPLCDGVLFRSLRMVHLLLSKYLMNMDKDSLRLVSKRCLSLESFVRHLLILSKDEVVVCNALKVFILLRVFLFNIDGITNDDELFERLVATTLQLLCENDKFYYYMPAIFHSGTEFMGKRVQSKLSAHSAYMQMRTVAEYLRHLSGASRESVDIDSFIPESETFNNFFKIYFAQMSKQQRAATIAINILKNFQDKKNFLNQDTRIYILRSFGLMLKQFLNGAKKLSDESNNLLLNIIYASSTLIAVGEELSKPEGIFTELLKTLMQMTRSTLQYSVIVRLSILKLYPIILRKLTEISVENVIFLTEVIIQGLNDPCWEIRDTVLEVLREIFSVQDMAVYEYTTPNTVGEVPCTFFGSLLYGDGHVPQSLVKRLQDEESFVRATAYTVLAVSASLKGRNSWGIYVDYRSLLNETTKRFQCETEGDVRERMIDFLVEGWRAIKINDNSVLGIIYETMYKASVNDLHLEVRRNSMMFWKRLIESLRSIQDGNDEQLLEKLFSIGCLQAIISGIEDEYDTEVRKIAMEALWILKPVHKTENTNLNGFSKGNLLNGLPPVSYIESDLLNAREFISKYFAATDADYPAKKNISEGSEFDLNDLLKCFADVNLEGGEINQKDCY